MSTNAKAWVEQVVLPTYLTGKVDPNPLFLENRVYQGSSGAVYPYGVIDSITDQKVDQSYQAVYIENDYIKIMLLPELGGRIHRAYDKVKGRDFVYYNEVVKPALVGLLGPWISGGIEFNWPQHHRPTTFMSTDFTIEHHDDGAVTVWMGEVEHMYGLQIMAGFKVYPNKALIEITGKVYNGNETPRQFLWWSNPAVKGVMIIKVSSRQMSLRYTITASAMFLIFQSQRANITRWITRQVPISRAIKTCLYQRLIWRINRLTTLSVHTATTSRAVCFMLPITMSHRVKNNGPGVTAISVLHGIVNSLIPTAPTLN